jgi:hypothetical protein
MNRWQWDEALYAAAPLPGGRVPYPGVAGLVRDVLEPAGAKGI